MTSGIQEFVKRVVFTTDRCSKGVRHLFRLKRACKTEAYWKIRICVSEGFKYLFCSALLFFALFCYLKKRVSNFSLQSLRKIKNHLFKPRTSESGLSNFEYEVLLQKINPINFMNPYDAEKVKLANDLYSALLKSRDNATIVKMIEEKAKRELKILI